MGCKSLYKKRDEVNLGSTKPKAAGTEPSFHHWR